MLRTVTTRTVMAPTTLTVMAGTSPAMTVPRGHGHGLGL
jgi:hypothetical protein